MPEAAILSRLREAGPFPCQGLVTSIGGGVIEADGPDCVVGEHCQIGQGPGTVRARVVAIARGHVVLAPFAPVGGVRLGDRVIASKGRQALPVGSAFAGRAIDGLGCPVDGGPPISGANLASSPSTVLDRLSPTRPLRTGVRVIDALLTIGHGQRVGVFAASGVGKTRLIEQILRQHDCARAVVCLVGERGREVEAMWRSFADPIVRQRTTLVAATSDELASMRIQAVEQALALAEFWRGAGEDVLLIIDSITRYAMALREVGLMAGEPPTLRAYTPNIFRELPSVVERCGAQRGQGTITGVFTVLSENDEVDDPLVEVMKSLLDGHIVLSRRLAQSGHFPAIDVNRSISRLFDALADDGQAMAATRCRGLLARYEESRILVESGMYKPGSDRELDAAIAARSAIATFSRQSSAEDCLPRQARDALVALAANGAV